MRAWRLLAAVACLPGLAACPGKPVPAEKAAAPVAQAPSIAQPSPVAQPSSAPAADGAAAAAQPIAPAGQADRVAPPVVPPVVRDGVRYAQAEDGRALGHDQVGGVLVATAADGGQRLWTLVVYDNRTQPDREADVQWRFFKSMAFDADGRLRIVNEASKTFLVDVKTRTVTPLN